MLKLWKHPSNYIGATWEGWLVFLGRNRDSDLLTNHNFETARDLLQALDREGVKGTLVVSENHWACGWVEWIAIHPSNAAAVALAESLANDLGQYPILDEDKFSEKEHEEAQKAWSECSLSERLQLIKRYGQPPVSILAARHDWIPQDDNGSIYEALVTR